MKMQNKTESELIVLIEKQAKEIGDLREEVGILKARLEISEHKRRYIQEEDPDRSE